MLSLTTEARLVELIGAIVDTERQIEVKRQFFAEEPLVSVRSAFYALDRHHMDYVSPYDLKSFLQDYGFVVTTEEAEHIVEFFGSKSKLRLYHDDFFRILLPADPILKNLILKREDYPYEPLTSGAKFALAKLIQAEIDGNNRLNYYWSSLKSRYDYNVFDAFRTIDKYRTGSITAADLSIFLKKTGHSGRFDDAEVFIRRLDTNQDGRLSYSEFVDGLIPSFAQNFDKYSYSEKKPSYYKRRLESPAPKSEYKPSKYRMSSEERYASPTKYESPLKTSYVSPYKESDYKKPFPAFKETPVSKKLEYVGVLSSSKKKELATELALAMEEQIAYEKKFEHAKEGLALQSDFNLMDGFRVFDYTGKGFITLTEFYDGLKELRVTAGYSEISLLFKRLDSDSDGRMRYSDYCVLFTPKRTEYEKMLASRPPYHMHHLIEKEIYFTGQTRTIYREALEIALEHEKALEGIRQRLKRSPSFNVYDAFNALDIHGKGQISQRAVFLCKFTKNSLKSFWKKIKSTRVK